MINLIICCLTLTILVQEITTNLDPASLQLSQYKASHKKPSVLQTSYGAPVDNYGHSLTVGKHGPMLIQDHVAIEAAARLVRRNIPARGNTGKGTGAFGYFEVVNDITNYTKADVFKRVGKRTNVFVRFSVLVSERGTPDTSLTRFAMAVKFYTKEGIWDFLGVNHETTFTRDVLKFISFVRGMKRNPATYLKDPNMLWDSIVNSVNCIYHIMQIFGDGLLPDGYRHMNSHAVSIFKMVNKKCEQVFVRFHILPNLGIKNLSPERALNLTGLDPDYSTRDLYNSIAKGNYPSWTLYIQVMTSCEAERYRENPFDPARPWLLDEFPYIPVGNILLNRNPTNYFEQVEQAAFSPFNLIPGIEPSPDKLLQSRLLVYDDAQYHRLGSNFMQIPVNCAFKRGVKNYQRNGQAVVYNQGGAPNYYPSSFGGPEPVPEAVTCPFYATGVVRRYNNTHPTNSDLAVIMWNYMTESERDIMVNGIAFALKPAVSLLQKKALKLFASISKNFADRLRKAIETR